MNKILRTKKVAAIKSIRKKSKDEDISPRPIPKLQQMMVEAGEIYIKRVPTKLAKKLVDVKYRLALIYYNYNHLDNTIKRCKDIIENHSKHKLTEYAIHMMLDAFNLKKNFLALNRWTKKFLANQEMIAGKIRLKKLLYNYLEGSELKLITGLEKEGKWKTVASKYAKLLKGKGSKKEMDKSLFNAAVAYAKAHNITGAIELRKQLIKRFPDSPLAPKAMFLIGQNYHSQGIYSRAASYYEALARSFPKFKTASKALISAALFRAGGNEYNRAIENYALYIRKYRKNKAMEEQRAHSFFNVGLLYEKMKKWRYVISHFKKYLRYYRNTPLGTRITARAKIGLAYFRLHKLKQADRTFTDVIKEFASLKPEVRKGLKSRPLDAVAQARFLQAEVLFKDYEHYKLTSVRKLTKQLKEKGKRFLKAKKAFEEVIQYRRPAWAIASSARVGQIYEEFAQAIMEAPIPRRLKSIKQKELYRQTLTKKALPILNKAKHSYIRCLKQSGRLMVYTKWTKLAVKRLSVLLPGQYSKANELIIQPIYYYSLLHGDDFIVQAEGKQPGEKNTPFLELLQHEDSKDPKVLQKMVTLLNNEVKGSGGSATTLFNLALAYEKLGRLSEALASYEKALTKEPKLTKAKLNMGRVLMGQKQYEPAIAVYNQILTKKPLHIKALNNMSLALMKMKKWPAAITSLRKVLAIELTNIVAYRNLALAYYLWGKYELALMVFNEGLKLKKEDAGLHNNLGLLYLKFGKLVKAVTAFKRALQIVPQFNHARINLAALALNYSDYGSASEQLNKALEIDKQSIPAGLGYALSLRGLKKFNEAEKEYQRLISLSPADDVRAYYNLGILYHEFLNNLKGAKKCFAQVVKSSKSLTLKADSAKRFANIVNMMKILGQSDTSSLKKEDGKEKNEGKKEAKAGDKSIKDGKESLKDKGKAPNSDKTDLAVKKKTP